MKAPFPANESARIEALKSFDMLDTPVEASFNDLVRLAADICAAPVALVSLVDGERQWFKARIGIDVTETSRDLAFCAHALHSTQLLEVEDARLDARFADNPLVTGEPHIRFYAGVPLATEGGEVLGTLCVIDYVARRLDPVQRRALLTLAGAVMAQMQLRRQLRLQARTEQALHESEQRWQFALTGGDQGVWDWNLQTGEVFRSERWATLLGHAPTDIIPRPDEWSSRVHPDDLAPTLALIRAHLAGDTPIYESEHRLRARDGSQRWILDRGRVVMRDTAGRALRMVGTLTDITARKTATLQTERMAALLDEAQHIAAMGSWEFDEANQRLTWSNQTCRLFGVPAGTFDGRFDTFLAQVHPDDRAEVALRTQQASPEAPTIENTYRVCHPDGDLRWMYERGKVVFDADGRPLRRLGMVADITDRERDRATLAATEARFRKVFESAATGIAVIVPDGRFVATNAAFRRMLGYSEAALHARTLWSIAHLDDLPHSRALMDELLDGRRDSFVIEKRFLAADEREVWCRMSVSMQRDLDGAPLNVIGVCEDITQQKQAERALQDSRRELLTLMGNLPGMVYRCRVDRDWTMEFVSEGALALTGHAPADLLGAGAVRYGGLIHPHDRERVRREVDAALAEDRPFELSYRIFCAQGMERRVWERGQGIRGDDGRLHIEGVIFDVSQRYKDEAQLRLLETCVARLGDIVVITEAEPLDAPDGPRILFVNDAFERCTGYAREEAIGRTPRMLQGPATQPEVRHRLREALRRWQPVREQIINYRKSGEMIWLELDIVPIADESGGYTHWVAIERDITERKLAEQAIRESEDRFRRLSRATNDAIWDWNLADRTLWWNDGFETLFGYDRNAVEPTIESWTTRIHPDDRERVVDGIRAVIDDGREHWSDNYRFRRSDGEYAHVVDRGYVIRDAEGHPTRMLGGMTDVSARKKADEELRTVATRLKHYLSVSPGVTYALKVHGDRIEPEWVSDSIEWLFGYTVEQTRAADWWRSNLHPGDREQAIADMATLTRRDHLVHEYRFRRADGRWIWINDHMRSEHDAAGITVRIVGTWTDVTDRRVAEDELKRYKTHLEELVQARTNMLELAQQQAEAANKAKSLFLANMSHEIRTPMNGVLGMLEVLAHGNLNAEQRSMLGTARESGRTLLALIDDILDFSKIEAGRLIIGHEPVSVADLAEELCDSVAPTADAGGVDLRVFIDPAIPPRIFADPIRLRQLLYNLVGNAIKFSGGRPALRGRVSLRVAPVDGLEARPLRLAFAIADNGTGMSDATIAGLFTPFCQGENSATRRFGGTGLGLTICRRLVELMSGSIQVASTPGVGSTFTVELPFDVAGFPAAPPAHDLTGVDCIVVADAFAMADIGRYLSHAGANVHHVDDESAAAGPAREGRPPVVVIRAGTREDEARALAGQERDEVRHEVRHVLVTPGRRRQARMAGHHCIALDSAALRRKTLLHAVAAAAGRASLEVVNASVGETAGEMTSESAGMGEASVTPRHPITVDEARARGQLILVAEDDPVNRQVITQQLTLLGAAAEVAHDGRQALHMWRAGQYALLLTDLHMPELDGHSLLRAIRAEEAGAPAAAAGEAPCRRPLTIIALTANALRGEAEKARAAGFDDYLVKPLGLAHLGAALERWLPAAAQADTRARPAIFDAATMHRYIGHNDKIVRELLDIFLTNARTQWQDIRRACIDGDAPRAAQLAHKLKSSSQSVGALDLSTCCVQIEAAAKDRRADQLGQMVGRLDNAHAKAERAIQAYLADPAPMNERSVSA